MEEINKLMFKLALITLGLGVFYLMLKVGSISNAVFYTALFYMAFATFVIGWYALGGKTKWDVKDVEIN